MIRRARGVETRFRKRLRSASHSPVSLSSAGPFADDLGVDPRLMTERQQLAFLLRTTAQDASSSSGADAEDEGPRVRTRRVRGPCAGSVAPRTGRRRGRPPKNAIMPTRRGADKENRPAARDEPGAGPWHAVRNLRSSAAKSEEDAVKAERPDAKLSADASPPSSATSACALCCSDARIVVDATAPLFLCATCDRKYPMQQALGRRTCTA